MSSQHRHPARSLSPYGPSAPIADPLPPTGDFMRRTSFASRIAYAAIFAPAAATLPFGNAAGGHAQSDRASAPGHPMGSPATPHATSPHRRAIPANPFPGTKSHEPGT